MTVHLQSLKCVPTSVRDKPQYVGDHVIRHYRPLGLAVLLSDIGADPTTPKMEIVGGIGTLTMYLDGREEWKSAIDEKFSRFANDKVVAVRLNICNMCSARQDGKCMVAGCACNGAGIPEHSLSKCPLGNWP